MRSRSSLSLSLAALLLAQSGGAQAAIRIKIHAPATGVQSGAAGGVRPVALGNMGLGGSPGGLASQPSLGGSLQALRVRGVTVAPPADVAVAAAKYGERAAPAPQALGAIDTGADTSHPLLRRSGRDADTIGAIDTGADTSHPLLQRSGRGSKEPARIDIAGEASERANRLSEALVAAGGAGLAPSGGLRLRETVGAAFDGSARLPQELDVVDGGITPEELFNAPGQASFRGLPAEEGERLARLADEVARWRGARAVSGEAALEPQQAAILRGIDDLARAVALGDTTPGVLRVAADIVERMPVAKLRRFSELADRFINTEVSGKSTPFARVGNVEHVMQQLIEPLARDGEALAEGFRTNPRQSVEHFVAMLRALQYATDTGKQQNPDDMGAALAHFNPDGPVSYINRYILPHEYASIVWVEQMGRQAGFTPREILAFQRLVANHNFGPNLQDPKSKAMRDHWWAKNFREQMFPMLAAMGVDVQAHFKPDENGVLQYGNTQGHPYSLLLSVYDRAIAVPANGNGMATWKKYGTQDFNQKKGRLSGQRKKNSEAPPGRLLLPDPVGARDENGRAGPVFEFDGPSVVRAMEATADWAEQHVESLWASLYATLPAANPLRARYPTPESFRMYPPFYAQRKSIGALLGVLRLTKADNPEGATNRADIVPGDGVAYYEARGKAAPGVYRVKLERTGPGAFDPRSTEYGYAARLEVYRDGGWSAPGAEAAGRLATSGNDPVALFTDLIRADQGW